MTRNQSSTIERLPGQFSAAAIAAWAKLYFAMDRMRRLRYATAATTSASVERVPRGERGEAMRLRFAAHSRIRKQARVGLSRKRFLLGVQTNEHPPNDRAVQRHVVSLHPSATTVLETITRLSFCSCPTPADT
jgi:hypothetical protein